MPWLAPLRTAAESGDWPATKAFFAALTTEDDRSFAASLVGTTAGAERYLESAEAEEPGDPLVRTLLAERYVIAGWEIRSDHRATQVSAWQFEQLHDHLRRAERLLIEVCAEYPDYALAWCVRLSTAMGLELGQSESRRRYDRLTEHHPHLYAAQSALLQKLCPKWGGSWEAVDDFTRACVAAAPPGGYTGTLIAEAHLERWAEQGHAGGPGRLQDPAVRDELVAAAAGSVLHPDFRPGAHALSCHGYFAATLSLGGHHTEAAPHFRAMGSGATSHPWEYLGDKQAAFLKHRATALAKG